MEEEEEENIEESEISKYPKEISYDCNKKFWSKWKNIYVKFVLTKIREPDFFAYNSISY